MLKVLHCRLSLCIYLKTNLSSLMKKKKYWDLKPYNTPLEKTMRALLEETMLFYSMGTIHPKSAQTKSRRACTSPRFQRRTE